MFVEPPKDLKEDGKIWRLKKLLYVLNDISRKLWLRIKEIFLKCGMNRMEVDEAFYYKYNVKQLEGMVLMHGDDIWRCWI